MLLRFETEVEGLKVEEVSLSNPSFLRREATWAILNLE